MRNRVGLGGVSSGGGAAPSGSGGTGYPNHQYGSPSPQQQQQQSASNGGGYYAAGHSSSSSFGSSGSGHNSNSYSMSSPTPKPPAPARPAYGGYSYQAPSPSSNMGAAYPTPTTTTSSRPTTSSSSAGSYGGYSGGSGTNSNYQSYGGYVTNPSAGQDYAFASNMNNASSTSRYDDNKYNKGKRRKSNKGGSGSDDGDFAWIILSVLAGAFFIWAVLTTVLWSGAKSKTKNLLKATEHDSVKMLQESYEKLQNDLRTAERNVARAERNAQMKVTQEKNALERQNRLLTKERDELRTKHEGPERKSLMEKVNAREGAYAQQVKWLISMARRESKREVLEKFGAGPHKVELTFAVPRYDSDGELVKGPENRDLNSIIIEMAPIDAVPHAVHLFLEQVDHGLLNGTYFYLNGPHILQAGPQVLEDDEDEEYYALEGGNGTLPPSSEIGTAGAKARSRSRSRSQDTAEEDDEAYKYENARLWKYTSLGLEKLAFPDYSDDFPHVPWTLGFTGRPGGPDWYINKVDNSEGHGPGGQKQHALREQGDSCFGIVSAEDSSRERLASLVFNKRIWGDRTSWHYFMEEPVEIVGAAVLTKLPSVHKIHMDPARYRAPKLETDLEDEEGLLSTSESAKPIGDVLDKAVQDLAMDPLEDPDDMDLAAAMAAAHSSSAGEDMTVDRDFSGGMGDAAAIAAAQAAAAASASAATDAAVQGEELAARAAASDILNEDLEQAENNHGAASSNPRHGRRHPRHLPKIDNQAEA